MCAREMLVSQSIEFVHCIRLMLTTMPKRSVFYYYVLQKRCIRSTILLNGTPCDYFDGRFFWAACCELPTLFFPSHFSPKTLVLIYSLYLCWLCVEQPLPNEAAEGQRQQKLCKTVWCTQFLSVCEGLCPTYTYMHTPGSVIFLSCVPWPFSDESVSSCCDFGGICFALVVAERRVRHTHTCVSLSVSAAV